MTRSFAVDAQERWPLRPHRARARVRRRVSMSPVSRQACICAPVYMRYDSAWSVSLRRARRRWRGGVLRVVVGPQASKYVYTERRPLYGVWDLRRVPATRRASGREYTRLWAGVYARVGGSIRASGPLRVGGSILLVSASGARCLWAGVYLNPAALGARCLSVSLRRAGVA